MAGGGKRSSGILLYQVRAGVLHLLIAHMGGPFWARKDAGAWSIPKGEPDGDEDPLAVARREFTEELGSPPPDGEYLDLGEFRQPSGKRITVFAIEGDLDASAIRSNTFELEWPKGSGKVRSFPEVDRAEWVPAALARQKLVSGQVPFVDALVAALTAAGVSLAEE